MDRLESMSLLVAVVEAGSFSGASRRLGIPLATVSRRIGELETHLGTRLLRRSTRQLSLTDAGATYVESCRRILDDVRDAERTAAGEYSTPKGDLVLTAPIVFGRVHVLPVVVEFLALYPEIDIRLVLADRLTHLLEEHIDLAVRIGALPDSTMIATNLGELRRVLCASPAYLQRHGTPAHPGDLDKHQCIVSEGLSAASGASAWRFMAGKKEIAVPVHARLAVNTAEAAIDAALAGSGLTRALSYQVVDAVRTGALQVVLEAFELPPWPVSLVRAGQGLLPLKLRTFIDFAALRLRERVAQATW